MKTVLILLTFCVIGLAACRNSGQAASESTIETTGTVEYVTLEGGFFGIVAEDGRKFDPANLPAEFQVDGLHVRFRASPTKDAMSSHMWGTLVEIEEIEKI